MRAQTAFRLMRRRRDCETTLRLSGNDGTHLAMCYRFGAATYFQQDSPFHVGVRGSQKMAQGRRPHSRAAPVGDDAKVARVVRWRNSAPKKPVRD